MTPRVWSLPALTRTTARRIAWLSVAGCLAAALLLTWVMTSSETTTTDRIHTVLRWSAVLLAGGVASVFDDPTEDDLAGAPTPVWWRRLLALVVVTVPTTAGWAAAIAVADEPLPWVALSIEAAALILLGCAVASSRPLRRSNLPAGLIATLPPAVVLVMAAYLPARWVLLVDPADTATWRAAHVRWGLLALGAALALAVTARDRARRPPRRALRAASPRPNAPAPVPSDTLSEAS